MYALQCHGIQIIVIDRSLENPTSYWPQKFLVHFFYVKAKSSHTPDSASQQQINLYVFSSFI